MKVRKARRVPSIAGSRGVWARGARIKKLERIRRRRRSKARKKWRTRRRKDGWKRGK